MKEYDVTNKEVKIRIGRYAKVIIESFHENAIGGGLLYFEVDSEKREYYNFQY